MKKSVLFSALLIAFMASAVFAQAPALPELADDHTMFCVTPLYENISNPTYLTGYTLFQKSHKNYDASTDLCVSYWYIPEDYRNKEGGFDAPPEVYFTVDEYGYSKTYYDTWTFLYAQLTGGFKQIRVQGILDFGDATDYTDPDVTCKSFEENNLAFQGKSFDVNEGGGFSGDANSSIQHICYVGNETSISFVNVVSASCSGAQNLTFDNVYFKSTNSGSGSVGILSNNDMLPLSFIRVFNSRFEGSTVGAIVGNTSKSVSDIRVENVIVVASGGTGFNVYAGGVAGYLGGDSKNDTLVNVQVIDNGDVIGDLVDDGYGNEEPRGGFKYIGGFAGYGQIAEMNGLLMENVTVSVDGTAQSADDYMGTGSGGEMYVGGAVGELFIGSNDVDVYNVSAKDVSVNVKGDAIGYSFDDYDYSGRAYVGGFLGNLRGEATGSEFKNITGEKIIVSVAAKNTGFDNKVAVGGFAGSCETGFSAGAVELIESQVENKARSKNNYVGGFVGYSYYSSYSADFSFDKMELDVDVSQSNTTDGDTAYVGGIFGLYYVDGVENTIDRIQNSELKGDVSSSCADELYIGGAIGKLDFAEHGGGVSKGNIEISKFAFVGDVKHGDCSGYTYAGGLLGEIDGNGLYPSAGSSASMGVTLQNTYTIGDIQTAGTGGSSVGYLVGAILQPDESQFGIGDYTFNLVVNGNYHYGENDLSVSSPFDRSSCELITGWLEGETSFDKVDLCSGYAAYSFSGTFNQGLVMTYRNGTSSAENIFNLALSDQLNSSDMKTDMFAALLNTLPGDGINSAWSRKDDVNNGLPIFADEKNDINAIYRLTFNVTSYCPTCADNNEKKTLLEGTLGDDFIVEASGQGTVLAYTANTYQGNLSTENFEKITSVNDKGVWFGSSSGGANVVLSKHGKVPAPLQLEPNPFLDEYPVFYYVNEYDGNGQLVSTTEIDDNSMVRFAGPVIRTYQMDDENTLVPSMFEMDYNNDNEVFYQLENVFLTQGDEASGTYNEYSAGDTVTHFSSIRAFLSNAKSYGYDIDAVRIYYKKLEEQKLHFATVHNRDANMPLYLDANAYVYGLDDITGVYSLGNAVNPTENTLFPITPSLSFDPTFGYDVKGFDVDFAIVGYDDATDVCQGKTPFDIEEEQTYETLTGDEFVEEKISSAMRDTYLSCKSTVWHFELGAEDSLHLDEFLKSYLSEEVDKNIQIYVTPKYNFVEYAIDFVRPTSEQFFVFSDYLGENWLESVSYTKENEDALILDARRFVTTYGNASGWAENKNAAQIDWAHNLSHLENIFTPTETEKTFYPVSCEFTSLADKSCLESDDVVVGNYAFTLKTDGNGSVELWQILGADNATKGTKADTIRHQFTAVAGAENTFEMLVPKLKDDAGGNDYMPFVFEIHAIPADDYAGGTYKLLYSVDGGAYESLKNGDVFAETEPENLVFDVSFKKPQINLAMFTFSAADGENTVFYGGDRVKDGTTFDYNAEDGVTEFSKIVYTSEKCLAGWAIDEEPVDGETVYKKFDENMGIDLKEHYPNAATSEFTLYARWTDDLTKCAAGEKSFMKVSYEGEKGTIDLNETRGTDTFVHKFTTAATMILPMDMEASKLSIAASPTANYELDSVVVDGSQYKDGDNLGNADLISAKFAAYFAPAKVRKVVFAYNAKDGDTDVFKAGDWTDEGKFEYVTGESSVLPQMAYTSEKCLQGWSLNTDADSKVYTAYDEQMAIDLYLAKTEESQREFTLYARWTDDLSKCAAGANAFTRISHEGEHGKVALGISDGANTVVHEFTSGNTMLVPTGLDVSLITFEEMPESGYALDSIAVKIGSQTVVRMPTDKLPNNYADAILRSYFSKVNLEARFAFVMGSKKDSVLYGDDWKKDFGVFNSVDEKKLPTMLYTVGECLEGWSVQNAQGEKYDIFDKQMGLKLEELNPDAHNSYSLYANWTDDLSMCAAGADAFTRVSYKSKHGAVTLQDTVTNMVYAFAPNRTMVLPSNTNGAAMKAFVDVEPGYALDSLVVKFDNKSIALKPGDNLPKNIVNATIWAYFSEDLKIPVEFVSPKVQLSGNALRFAFSTTEFRIDGQALVSILLENEKGWKARQKFDVKTVPYNESWKKFYLPSGDYVLTAKLINGADTVEFKKDSIVVESEIKSAGPDGWQMVSLYSVEMNEYRHDDDAVFYWWDESSSAGDFWHYKELGFTPVKRGVGYWYNSIEGRGLKLRDASDKDSVLASSAYWDLDSVYSGWNLVANPNGFKIDVSTSPDYYDEMEFLRWNTEAGEYEPVKVLDPYEAVWVKVNDKSRFALPDRPLFAEDGGNALQKSGEARTLAKASGKDNWTLQVVLADNNGKRDSYNMIGVGKKRLSVEEPPEGMGEHVALSFVEGKKSLAKSVKAPADEVEWTMELKANSNRMGSLSLDGVGKLNAMGLKVFVTVDGKTTEISEGQKLNVALSSKSKFATVRVAEKARVTVAGQLNGFKAIKVGTDLQVSFDADQNLAGTAARVDLVDLKGDVVASAAAKTLAGVNRLTLTAPKPGLYMVRVRAGSQMGAGKVVVK